MQESFSKFPKFFKCDKKEWDTDEFMCKLTAYYSKVQFFNITCSNEHEKDKDKDKDEEKDKNKKKDKDEEKNNMFKLRSYISDEKPMYRKGKNEFIGHLQYYDEKDKWLFVSFFYLNNENFNIICKHFGYKYGYLKYNRTNKNWSRKQRYSMKTKFMAMNCPINTQNIKECKFKKFFFNYSR